MPNNMTFLKATECYNTFEQAVPAPYLRKVFACENATKATVTVAACGFYELYLDGVRYTKGHLAPYISNTDHYVYYDEYEIELSAGDHAIGLHLGNGFQNNPGGYIWDFDQSPFRSAPMVAVSVCNGDGAVLCDSATGFKTAPSPITTDDYRFGEVYDARLEVPGWNTVGFDDSAWADAIVCASPKGA
ncbi:MAG: alpha-L-rhamnosidase N-terminal domain-containing protein, partial [Clostridia bacterium]|nr:alpha-L-rhamnosidase N-terminal domain-containing protein [Clostridia bacterium]